MKTFLFIVKHKTSSLSGFNEYIENIELINIDAKSELDAETYLELERCEDPLVNQEAICLNRLHTNDVVSLILEFAQFHANDKTKNLNLTDFKIILNDEGKEADFNTYLLNSIKEPESNEQINTAHDLINFEKQLSKFEKDTLTTYMASLAVDWTEEQMDAFIAALCMIEELISPKNTETGASDSTPGQPASATDELTK